MDPLRYATKFDPFHSLDCAPTLSTLAQSKESKGSNVAIWQPWIAEGTDRMGMGLAALFVHLDGWMDG